MMSVTKEQLDEYLRLYQLGTPVISDEEYDVLLEEFLKEHGESLEENNEEKWMPIKYKNVRKGMYEVSNYGNIRRVDNKREMKKVLRGGYYSVKLCISDNESKHFPVHRLVAHAFVKGQSSENNIVNHLDGDKLNDVWLNLEWCNPQHNVIHAYLTGLNKNKGSICHLSKITNPIAEKICELLVENDGDVFKVSQILSRNNISCSYETIRAIKEKKSWRWLSNKYFVKNEYKKQRMFTDCDVRKICQTLIKYKGDISMVYDELKDTIQNLKPSHISEIKNKKVYKDISDSYFNYTTFIDSDKIPTEQLDFVRELLITNVMKGSPSKVYDSLNHEKYYKLTLAVIKMISAGHHDSYNRSNIYDLNEYYSDKDDCKYRPISEILLNKLLISYSSGNPDITDSAYDELLEDRIRVYGESQRPFLRQTQTESVADIVGSLRKVYGVTTPMRPGQLTYREWRMKRLPARTIILQPKFDGCSVAYDLKSHRFFTRGDTDNGESVDVTDLFKNHDLNEKNLEGFDAIKFEAILSKQIFNELFSKLYKRPRDVVSAAIHSRETEVAKYITLIPLRKIKNKHLYVSDTLAELSTIGTLSDDDIQLYIDNLLKNAASQYFQHQTYECDGVVVSIVDNEKIANDEIAIKILNLQKKSKLKKVIFSMGKSGRVTPVAEVEPVKFDNVTVTNISLENLNRMTELKLGFGDTVNIMYNIRPYLLSSDHDGGPEIPIPDTCPVCGYKLTRIGPEMVGCENPTCRGNCIGSIVRYCENMKMYGISTATIESLYDAELIKSISDLYRLKVEDISKLEGFGIISAKNIVNSINNASTLVNPLRWLSALPCRNIGLKTWTMICNGLFDGDILKLGNVLKEACGKTTPNLFIEELCQPVFGVDELTLQAIKVGVTCSWRDIFEMIKFITFDTLTPIKTDRGVIVMSGTRDKDLKSYLESIGYEVSDSFKSDAKYVVVPDLNFQSSKVTKAKQKNIPIISIKEAMKLT